MRNYYYRTEEFYPPAASPPPPRRGGGRRGTALFLCALVILAAVTAAAGLLGRDLAAELPPLDTNSPAVPTAQAAPEPVARAPLGDGTTLVLAPEPAGEPWSLQEIYAANLPSIVSVRGSSQEGYSLGTGVVMSQDGYIITNCHVIEGCSRLDIVLWDERSYDAALVGQDEETDLAVLKIDGSGLLPATFGDSSLAQVGDPVAAIGNPLGSELRGTMTDGIISAINRNVRVQGRTMTLIQTNAALNSGNSGGALINQFGQVIGITNMKMRSYTTPVEGLGFAIPTATVKLIVDTLIADGVVGGRPTIGITAYTLTPEMALQRGCPPGVWVETVEERSDAWAQGLRPGDVIVQANGADIALMEELQSAKAGLEAGDAITLRFWRSGSYQTVEIILVEQYMLEE